MISIVMSEWSDNTVSYDKGCRLDVDGERHATQLAESGIVEILELAKGIRIRTNSHVGRIDLGNFILDIRPKLQGMCLARLLWYAYGLGDLKLHGRTLFELDKLPFFDLLIHSLLSRVDAIIRRGFVKAYEHRREELTSIRGRIDIGRIASGGGILFEKVPCSYHHREDDTHLNRILLAGLKLVEDMAIDGGLRHNARQFATILSGTVSESPLNKNALDAAARGLNRLTEDYAPALELIALLYEKSAPSQDRETGATIIPGFFFDMNLFFEKLVGKLLKTLPDEYGVVEQIGLRNLVQYNAAYNPQKRQSPIPRPDFLLKKRGVPQRIFDAKYRDLWENILPRNMLYQLAMYSLAGLSQECVSILYPTTRDEASVQIVNIQNPQSENRIGSIAMLPLNLNKIGKMLEENEPKKIAQYIQNVILNKND